MGFKGVEAAIRLIRTGARVKGEPTGTTYVTRNNLESNKVQSVLNPNCKNPPT
jgi:hypothetical protein